MHLHSRYTVHKSYVHILVYILSICICIVKLEILVYSHIFLCSRLHMLWVNCHLLFLSSRSLPTNLTKIIPTRSLRRQYLAVAFSDLRLHFSLCAREPLNDVIARG